MKLNKWFLESNLKHIGLAIFLIIYLSILSYKVISKPTPFISWDESIYVQVGKEMLNQKSIVPLWQGQPWFEKPPLAPLVYAVIADLPVQPEVSTRLFSILLTGFAFLLLYLLFYKAQKSAIFALFVVITTAANPIVLQRAQIVNTDVFLLIGWLGYLLFYENFSISTIFLLIGVLSKSVLGIYPLMLVAAFELYKFIMKRDKKQLILSIKQLGIQLGIASLWYLLMIVLYGNSFIKVHFIEHLVERYTKSLETHFGHLDFYINLFFIQYGNRVFISVASVLILTFLFIRKKIEPIQYFLSLALLPWLIFINFAKTKLDWYVYPAVPQVLFLIIYPVTLLQLLFKKMPIIYIGVMIVLIANFIGNNYELKQAIFTTTYSQYDNEYNLATTAKNNCTTLAILADQSTRNDVVNLKSAGLAISTTEWYGKYPAIIYYFGKKVQLYYDKERFIHDQAMSSKASCWSFDQEESDIKPASGSFSLVKKFGVHSLYKRV